MTDNPTTAITEENLHGDLAEIQQWVHEVNLANGWFEADRTFGDEVALLHSEVSEMLEDFRSKGDAGAYYMDEGGETYLTSHQDYEGNKPLGVPSECADVLIRLLDTCARYDIDLEAEVVAKLKYNATRGHRHGGKAL